MPPQLLFDISTIDLNHVAYDQEAIREANPQRGDMEHLNAIVYAEPSLGRVIGYKDVRDDEFWVPGHIPGRPLLPGVIMIEAAAQMASFYTPQVHWLERVYRLRRRQRNPLPPGGQPRLPALPRRPEDLGTPQARQLQNPGARERHPRL